jgi:ubiquinone/menaquinone biosynthesis C-methylase UbiE
MDEQRNNNVYEGFAYSYDLFMDNIPYDSWAEYLQSIFLEYGVSQGLVLELACGTGSMTKRMADRGYDMIGIDFSEDMLEIAREKCSPQVLFLQQDMREMELYGTVSAMYCVCDGMNYLLEPQDLQKVFAKANNYLEPGGVFVFDMKTEYFYGEILGNRVIAENREDASFLWENEYHRDTCINEYLLTVYRLEDEERDLFSRCDELHYQRAYGLEQVQNLLEAAGMEFVAVYDALTRTPPTGQSERVYFIARERYQEGKYYDK